MKIRCLLPLFICYFLGFSQKRVEKRIVDTSISTIAIASESCFQVMLSTVASDEISVEAKMDGEYSADLEVILVERGNTLKVSAGFSPEFENPNDKLSAHKVVSISLNIQVPEYKNISLVGNSTRVIADGNYRKLTITLADGSCELRNVGEVVKVKTYSGAIVIYEKAAEIVAESKYGMLSDNPIPFGPHKYDLHTVMGKITLHKTE